MCQLMNTSTKELIKLLLFADFWRFFWVRLFAYNPWDIKRDNKERPLLEYLYQ